MSCEDFPCCGHEPGGCPTYNENGEEFFPCACCGSIMPPRATSAVCAPCHKRMRHEENRTSDGATATVLKAIEDALCHEHMRLEDVRHDRRRLGLDTTKAEEAMANMAEAMRWLYENR